MTERVQVLEFDIDQLEVEEGETLGIRSSWLGRDGSLCVEFEDDIHREGARVTDWRPQARCRDYSPRLFFREETSELRGTEEADAKTKMAKRICRSCPVIRECLTEAITIERAGSIYLGLVYTGATERPTVFTASYTPPWGIWGGTGPEERHNKRIKHYELVESRLASDTHRRRTGSARILVCATDPKCKGCRPVEERVDLLLERQGVMS